MQAEIAALAAELAHEKQLATSDATAARAFPPFLQATLLRRKALEDALADIARRIAAAEQEIAETFRGLKAYELAQEAAEREAAREAARNEQKQLDEIGGRIGQRAAAVSR